MKFYKIMLLTFFAYTLISCGGADERKAVYLEKAKASIVSGNLDKARIELKNVLQIDPKYAEGYFQLGKIYEQQKEYSKAYANFKKAEELDPLNLENQAKLGRIYLLLANDEGKAQEKIDLILSKDQGNVHGLLLKAAMLVRKGDIAKAISIVKGIVDNDPGHAESAAFLATLYAKEGENEKAIRVLDAALKDNSNDLLLNKLLATALVKNKDYKRAEVLYKGFLDRNPDNAASYNNMAAFYHQTGNKEKSVEMLRASIENDQGDVNRILTLVKYINEIKSDEDVISELLTFIDKNKGMGQLRTVLARVYQISGNKQKAIDVYNRAISDFPEEVTGISSRTELANIYIGDKEFAKAEKLVDDAMSISPNDPDINFLRAKLAVHNKDFETATISLRIVTKDTPENIDAFILLSKIYQNEGNVEQVRSVLNSAFDNNKNNAEALLRLAGYQVARDINEAEKIIDRFNELKPDDYEGMSIKSAILNKKKEYSEAYKFAKLLMEKYPDKPNGYLTTFPYYVSSGDNNSLIAVLEKGYMNAKDNRKLLTLLTTAQVIDNKFDVAEKRVKAELEASPDNADLKLLLAKIYIASNSYDMAEKTLKSIIKSSPKVDQSYLLLSKIYQKENEADSLQSILEEGKKNVPTSYEISFRLASVYESKNMHLKSLEVYRDLYNLFPDNYVIINNLASIISEYKAEDKEDMAFAKTLIEKLLGSADKNAAYLDTIGWVYYKLNDYQNAIQYLQEAVDKLPKVRLFNYHLGMAYKMAGDNVQATKYLEASLSGKKTFKYKKSVESALKEIEQ